MFIRFNKASSHLQGVHQRQLEELRQESQELGSKQLTKLGEVAEAVAKLDTCCTTMASKSGTNASVADEIASLTAQMSHLSVSEADVSAQHSIIRSLDFYSRPVREVAVPEAHSRTFKWVVDNQTDQDADSKASRFLNWLRHGTGTFWITGKPGSGKSTLMKFVARHSNTSQALSEWSHPKPSVVARHFFWIAGTSMQKSLQGLLQTLLHDIFQQLPELIEGTCLERWLSRSRVLQNQSWNVSELKQVVQRIACQNKLSVKFCFFIDGLDEFEGDPLDFCTMLQDLSNSEHVKICIASRPWNVFEDFFGQTASSKLCIHELTRNDIRAYAESRLQEHPRWKQLEIEFKQSRWLMEEITKRSAGVFLWVYLVTRELRNGLSEYDSFLDMQKRLESIPTELEAFFKQILDSVDRFYHPKLATTLQIALTAKRPAPFGVYLFHDREYDDEDYALKLSIQASSETQTHLGEMNVRRQLSRTCRGLLELNEKHGYVEFLHRTVMDYLKTPEMHSYLGSKAPAWADADLSLTRAFTAQIKSSNSHEVIRRYAFAHYDSDKLVDYIKAAIAHAADLGRSLKAFRLLDELDRCIPELYEIGKLARARFHPSVVFREMVLVNSLTDYLQYCLPKTPDYFLHFNKPVLSSLFRCEDNSPFFQRHDLPRASLVRCLLNNGCNPNATYDGNAMGQSTPWIDLFRALAGSAVHWNCWLTTKDVAGDLVQMFYESNTFELLSLMLQHNADPNCPCLLLTQSHRLPALITFAHFSILTMESSCETPYLKVLDDLIIAGAELLSPVFGPDCQYADMPGDFASQADYAETAWRACTGSHGPVLGLEFLFGLFFWSLENVILPLNYRLGGEVVVRLLSAVMDKDVDTDCYWTCIQNLFPQRLHSQLRSRIWGTPIPMHEPSTSNGILRIALDGRDENERSDKRLNFTRSDSSIMA